MKRTYMKLTFALVTALVLLVTAGCGGGSKTPQNEAAGYNDPSNPIVTIEMDNGDKITVELFPKVAPNTVNNFISLVQKGFYDGLIFHRVIPGFMIQGGDPEGTGTGGPDYGIKGEFTSNGIQNDLKHTRGVISMARSEMKDSAGSQFFIMAADSPHLDGSYAAFGQVLEGMETVDAIVAQKTGEYDRPLTPMAMKKVTVDTKGVTYPEPETVAK
ncbi:peptidylprolyl isomerase [Paenibacillus gorillae]|uniref:peptidylprolyl isomerase n=1 Tax=Paenibacillus gorillae TaxID=1243662 RepID=UPI0004B282CE|nr:peptidylprolyl isomerase [Paenibacillus gorillae]